MRQFTVDHLKAFFQRDDHKIKVVETKPGDAGTLVEIEVDSDNGKMPTCSYTFFLKRGAISARLVEGVKHYALDHWPSRRITIGEDEFWIQRYAGSIQLCEIAEVFLVKNHDGTEFSTLDLEFLVDEAIDADSDVVEAIDGDPATSSHLIKGLLTIIENLED